MVIYIDDMNFPLPNGGKSCHLTCIPDQGEEDWRWELHQFAEKIGMKRAWYQEKAGKFGHYDAMGIMIERALAAGANPIEAQELLRLMKERDGIVRQ